ncbi:MAG: undecaprenyldiphospho-muramoylpentapeptide beta-N-acetylglucosaminyltransferase [Hyphomicrobiaceae bacterium]
MSAILLAAGGTGGHLFPAQALAEALVERGFSVVLATDHRIGRHSAAFPADRIVEISSATLASKSPVDLAKTSFQLAKGLRQARHLISEVNPAAVIGFGGYPSFPPVMAAIVSGVATAIHEQNAVLGRANKLLAKRVAAVATSFPDVQHTENLPPGRVVMTGNPVRARVRQTAEAFGGYASAGPDDRFRLVVFGGSQGARYFSDTVPEAIAELSDRARARLEVIQQCRPEDLERVQARYSTLGVSAECAPFFDNLPEWIASSHLVLARSGASTVAEIAVLGRPSILVPLPHAVENDQLQNALRLEAVGGCLCQPQTDLTPHALADLIARAMAEPEQLQAAAIAARALGRPDAHERLADLVGQIARQA